MGLSRNFKIIEKTNKLKKDTQKMLSLCETITLMECDRRENPFGNYDNNFKVEDKIFDSKEDAQNYLESLDRYKDGAVMFRDFALNELKNKKIEDLEKRIEKNSSFKKEYFKKNELHNRKSKTVKCDCCGSILNIEYLTKDNKSKHNCPLCQGEFFSPTVVERLKKFDTDELKLKKEIKKEQKKLIEKNIKKAKILWMFKVDVHC